MLLRASTLSILIEDCMRMKRQMMKMWTYRLGLLQLKPRTLQYFKRTLNLTKQTVPPVKDFKEAHGKTMPTAYDD